MGGDVVGKGMKEDETIGNNRVHEGTGDQQRRGRG
jgi:hypothetical protein